MVNKKTLGLVLVILGFALLALTGIRTVSSPDIFTHIALGQAEGAKADPLSYTMADKQWINLSPLYDKLVYQLWSVGGAGLVTLIHVLLVIASFGLMLRLGKDWGGPLSQTLALLLCARLMLPVFNPGPSAFFILFTALYLTLLYRVKNFNLLAGIVLVLQVLWTNMHPSFLFGPLIVLMFAIENWQITRNTSRGRVVTPLTTRLFILAGAALLVTLINPNLINLHTHIFTNWKLLSGKEHIEWISLFSNFFPQTLISSLTVFALLLGAGGLITLQKRLPVVLTTLALVGAFLTVRSIGSLHLFAFLAFPFMILSFNAVSDYLSRTLITVLKTSNERLHTLLSAMALLLTIASILSLVTNRAYATIGSASRFGLGVEEGAFPTAVDHILSREDFPKTILNIPHDGGYLALKNPNQKIFCDTRYSFYGSEFYKSLDNALRGDAAAWNKILSDWRPHAAVLNGCWPDSGALANRLIGSGNWKLVYFDGATFILIRNLPEYEALMKDPSIQQSGLAVLEKARQDYLEQNKGFLKGGNPSHLIGAGSLYLALNRPKEAEVVFAAITENNPKMAGAWLGLGQSMVYQKKLSAGIEMMEKAADITPRNGRVWIALLNAYLLKNDEAKATYAADQLNKFYKADKVTVEQKEMAEGKKKQEKPADTPEAKPELKGTKGLALPSELK